MFRQVTFATIGLVAIALAFAGRAEAGASASAPLKYSRSHQTATSQQAKRNDFAITEYSSSSARTRQSARCSTSSYC